LVGFTGSGPAHVNWKNFDENVAERLDRLIHSGKLPPLIVVFPDCFTSMGGNQYINSSAIGRYADYLTRELIPFVDREFRTHASREHRGCFGKSSGGYGSMIHGMRYPQYWGAIANHSGDAYFDFIYRSEWPAVLTHLQNYKKPRLVSGQRRTLKIPTKAIAKQGHDDGRVKRFLETLWANPNPSQIDVMTLMMLGMAASYDPDKKAPNGFRLPFDLDTGQLLPRRWQAWLRHDPIELVSTYKDNLKSLKGIFIDCGWRDQFHIHYGARQLSLGLHKHGIRHRYEEFDATHSAIDYRMDVSLPFLARCLR
jgi:S-formylglutathione hydrolase FrmB